MKRVFVNKKNDQFIDGLKINWSESKVNCDYFLHILTDDIPAMVEAIKDICVYPSDKIVICLLQKNESLNLVYTLAKSKRVKVFKGTKETREYFNTFYVDIKYSPNLIECLIDRDGPTEIVLKKFRYIFDKNDLNDCVCEILSADHRKYLLSLPDFRVYQAKKVPTQKFTTKEMDFIAQWEIMDATSFLAYVNGHIDMFLKSSIDIKSILAAKWEKILSHMECPVLPLKKKDIKFFHEWKELKALKFQRYFIANRHKFLTAPDFLWKKATAKWQKLITDKKGFPLPYNKS